MNNVTNRQLFVRVLLITCMIASCIAIGCHSRRPTAKMSDLKAQAEKDVRLFDVQIVFGEQTIPLGLLSKGFAATWFPIHYEQGEQFLMKVIWQEDSGDASQTTVVTVAGPSEAEWGRFEGVLLLYTKADGWTGKLRFKDSK